MDLHRILYLLIQEDAKKQYAAFQIMHPVCRNMLAKGPNQSMLRAGSHKVLFAPI